MNIIYKLPTFYLRNKINMRSPNIIMVLIYYAKEFT